MKFLAMYLMVYYHLLMEQSARIHFQKHGLRGEHVMIQKNNKLLPGVVGWFKHHAQYVLEQMLAMIVVQTAELVFTQSYVTQL